MLEKIEKETNNTWLILLGGEYSFSLLSILNKEEYQGMICADSGANHAFAFGFIPDLVIGDFDSIDPQVKDYLGDHAVEFLYYSEDKDYTDGELAIEAALQRGAERLYILGAFGGRRDQELANIFIASAYARSFRRIILLGGDFYAFFGLPQEEIAIKGNTGDNVSLLPLSPQLKEITIEGFKYPLNKNDLSFGTTWGLSNKLKGEKAKIYFEEGLLLIIHDLKIFDDNINVLKDV